MSARKKIDWTKVLAALIGTAIIVVIFAISFGIRLWITGGDVGCVFSQDPALCVAVKDRP